MSSYWELLKDPRWQRKRLEVMQAADFTCQECFSTTKTLNVHHTHYRRGAKPWEYENADLRCLCEDCHAVTEAELAELRKLVGQLGPIGRGIARGFLRGLAYYATDTTDDRIPVESYPAMQGIAKAFGLSDSDVYAVMVECGGTDVDGDALARLAATRHAEG